MNTGDIDDSVFIVQSGKLNVLINNSDGTTLSLKHVKRGESVTSLLSFCDVLAVSLFLFHCKLVQQKLNVVEVIILKTIH